MVCSKIPCLIVGRMNAHRKLDEIGLFDRTTHGINKAT
ncbi:hypothetical protein BSU04_20545 [Caballeronia sordidicola]|uniref:Uncharacterized protein n=1 Tax=Caballeronia sordidicola TaxID=196367 RepID=A0A226WZQ9_CABSO|nr:hypothetical protein BSU04_20545 [Caballeronia sordidicola]